MKFPLAAMALLSAASPLAATAAYAEETAPPPALLPALSGPLSYNPNPVSVDVAGSKVYVSAIGSGYLARSRTPRPESTRASPICRTRK